MIKGWTVQDFFDVYCQHTDKKLSNIKPDFHLGLLGSGITYADCQEVSVFNKRHDLEYVIDGPSPVIGDGFDAKVLEGFFELLHQINQGKTSLHITGHSRGAVEAIAINNLLVLLKSTRCDFIQDILSMIKSMPEQFLPAHLQGADVTASLVSFVNDAKEKLRNTEIHIGLTLLDPVQGPDTVGFNHSAFLFSKSLMLDGTMHDRVDIIMGSRETAHFGVSRGFDLHLPAVKLQSGKLPELIIHMVSCNHGDIDKKLCEGGKTGSVEGHYAASVLSGKSELIQTCNDFEDEHAQCSLRTQDRRIEPSYVTRNAVYAAGTMIKPIAKPVVPHLADATFVQSIDNKKWSDLNAEQTLGVAHLG